jgi:hypothetical protein
MSTARPRRCRPFPRIRWIAGGLGKDGGIAALEPFLGSVVKAYLIGHSARDFALQIGETPHEICETMERAVARAAEEAQPGEVVLLAPAAASFDQYPNFEKRGEDFTARAVLSAAGMALADIVRLTVYTTDVDLALQNFDLLGARMGRAGVAPPMTLLGVTRLALPPLMIELEATAAT